MQQYKKPSFYTTISSSEEECNEEGDRGFQTFLRLLTGDPKSSMQLDGQGTVFFPLTTCSWPQTSPCRPPARVLTHKSLLLDPTVLAGLGAGFWAGGELASLGPQALPGAASWTSLRKITDRERSHRGFSEDAAWIRWALLSNLDLLWSAATSCWFGGLGLVLFVDTGWGWS